MTGKTGPPATDLAPAAPEKEPVPTPKEGPPPAPAAEEPSVPTHPPATEQPTVPADEPAPVPTVEVAPAPEEGLPAPPAEPQASEPKPEKPKAELPSPPLSLAVEEVSENSITLTWKAPEQTGQSGLDGYVVEICKDGSTDWTAVNKEPFLSTRYTIQDLGSGDKINVRVKAVSASGASVPATLEQPVLIREILQLPRIRMPRHLRQTYVRRVGDAINVMIPFQGKPQPEVIWTKGGQPLDTSHINIRNTDKDTIFYIREAQRTDSGKYELTVRINGAEDKATLDIQVIEPPGPPQKLKLVDVWGFNVALEWTPPADNGNSEIKGYLVQKSDKKSGKWFMALERCTRTSCTISDLIIGNIYSFRVFAENACGLSEKAAVTSGVAHIEKSKTAYQPEKIPQRDMMEPPKFTQPLTDRITTRGYSTHLFCCVRGFPQPKIIWMKNQMEIREDPKYIAMIKQGVCSLEIRKPSPFDGGIYTCKAVNALGEASVDCKLDVKGEPKDTGQPCGAGASGFLGLWPSSILKSPSLIFG
ncbi:myosin-binding protein H isoform X1 [Opisthocomus hoazin]|uniref:myosin-binding protein H isoform X1 n=1 Tax=Opisthocomus hoazin TaxID=30419 RepID=UPI003F5353C2